LPHAAKSHIVFFPCGPFTSNGCRARSLASAGSYGPGNSYAAHFTLPGQTSKMGIPIGEISPLSGALGVGKGSLETTYFRLDTYHARRAAWPPRRREIALDLVSRVDFWSNRHCKTSSPM
jgi:hypothetical protein